MLSSQSALLIVAILLAKHCVFDFILQTRFQLANKKRYGHVGGVLHGLLHVLGTLPVFLVLAPTPLLAAVILGGEFVVHYHVDWGKEQLLRRLGWTYVDARYWAVFGADQLLHGLTYVAIAWVMVTWA